MVHRRVSEAQSGVEARLRSLVEKGEGVAGRSLRGDPRRPVEVRELHRAVPCEKRRARGSEQGRLATAGSEEGTTWQSGRRQCVPARVGRLRRARRRRAWRSPGKARARRSAAPSTPSSGGSRSIVKEGSARTQQAAEALTDWRSRLERERRKAMKQFQSSWPCLQSRARRERKVARARRRRDGAEHARRPQHPEPAGDPGAHPPGRGALAQDRRLPPQRRPAPRASE